ncbi:MAG: hypothetical protein JW884_14190 [Deltaproteobacteria bacterium]|nr:hypothetical protein [Deltaproteobacteria bacterium]
MPVEANITQYFIFLLTLVGVWGVLIIGVVQWIMNRCLNSFDDRFKKMEGEILEMKISLPLEYVRREDFIPFSVRISAKMDALAALIHEIKGGIHG